MSQQASHTDAVAGTFQEALAEGRDRLTRSTSTLLATGLVGGIDLGLGVLALLFVRHQTGSELLGALAFSIGFIALILARSELFTENFLVPVLAVVADDGRPQQVARLWGGTLVMNLLGGWLMMAIVVLALPELARAETTIEVGQHFIDQGIGRETFASALLGGASITLLTWMERSSTAQLGKIAAAVGMAFVLAGAPLLHSIVTSLEMFASLQAGAPFGYLDWFGMFSWAVLGNVIGGIGLVTLLRLVQVRGGITSSRDRDKPSESERDATASTKQR